MGALLRRIDWANNPLGRRQMARQPAHHGQCDANDRTTKALSIVALMYAGLN